MHGNSKFVISSQSGPHKNLPAAVNKHLSHRFRRPYAEHTLEAFEQVNTQLKSCERKLIFDSGCGTGESSLRLAHLHPNHWVIGIDRSAHRLRKSQPSNELPNNLILCQADIMDFWRLACEHRWQLDKHFIFYPNPYPKPTHYFRRWHCSPVFPNLLQLSGQLEVRSNWHIYTLEMQQALAIAGFDSEVSSLTIAAEPSFSLEGDAVSPFELKYSRSQHPLWACTAKLKA